MKMAVWAMALWMVVGAAACGSTSASEQAAQVQEREAPRASQESEPEHVEEPAIEVAEPVEDQYCHAARDFAAMSAEEAAAWREECKAAFDCEAEPPVRACCMAMTPQCIQCARDGEAEFKAFSFACFGETTTDYLSLDCSQPPPLKGCCKALLPKCLDCVAKNRYVSELHRRQCGETP